MYNKNLSGLFAVVMILFLVPFLPAFVEQQLSGTPDVLGAETTHAATRQPNIGEFISAGYVGQYGFLSLPDNETSQPQVLGVSTERSYPPGTYRAEEVSKIDDVINLNPGQGVTVWVDFLNTGTSTWYNDGEHFVAVNVSDPAGRSSAFQHEFWKEYYYRPGRLWQDEVRPGEVGRFRFALLAPQQPGTYREQFNLVAENLTWIDGGHFEFLIGVGERVKRPPAYRTQQVNRSHGGTLEVGPGQAFTFWIDFENTGLKNWYSGGEHFIALNVADPPGRVSPLKHDFWTEYYYRPTRLLQPRIYPGETGRFRFALRAPNVEGYYTETFALVAENLLWIPGGAFTIKFKVGNPASNSPPIVRAGEPNVRIGLYSTAEPVTVTANGAYAVTNVSTGKSSNKSAGQSTTVAYSENAYWRLVPKASTTIMEISSFENRPSWNRSLNDNTFRGAIEIRYSPKTGKLWVINELPLESYLGGLAEVVNGQPEEYLKTLMVAARSYALWHYVRGGKHPDEHFDINATTDQVYRGYGFEQRSTDPLQAVEATTGTAITHHDAVSELNPRGVALAPYSSGTDGRTRSWGEVWAGGGYAWLVSVADPYGVLPNWDTLAGNHMVGLSAQGARGYALNENKTYGWILKHYYTGVNVEKIY